MIYIYMYHIYIYNYIYMYINEHTLRTTCFKTGSKCALRTADYEHPKHIQLEHPRGTTEMF